MNTKLLISLVAASLMLASCHHNHQPGVTGRYNDHGGFYSGNAPRLQNNQLPPKPQAHKKNAPKPQAHKKDAPKPQARPQNNQRPQARPNTDKKRPAPPKNGNNDKKLPPKPENRN